MANNILGLLWILGRATTELCQWNGLIRRAFFALATAVQAEAVSSKLCSLPNWEAGPSSTDVNKNMRIHLCQLRWSRQQVMFPTNTCISTLTQSVAKLQSPSSNLNSISQVVRQFRTQLWKVCSSWHITMDTMQGTLLHSRFLMVPGPGCRLSRAIAINTANETSPLVLVAVSPRCKAVTTNGFNLRDWQTESAPQVPLGYPSGFPPMFLRGPHGTRLCRFEQWAMTVDMCTSAHWPDGVGTQEQ